MMRNLEWRVFFDEIRQPISLNSIAYTCGFRVSEISRILGVTEQHLRRIFFRDVGIPIKCWLRMERMVIARRMLSCGIDVCEASELLSFANPNSFRREFKNIYELSPREFKKIHARRSRFFGDGWTIESST
jgi:AraC-like DNA-binding protein